MPNCYISVVFYASSFTCCNLLFTCPNCSNCMQSLPLLKYKILLHSSTLFQRVHNRSNLCAVQLCSLTKLMDCPIA